MKVICVERRTKQTDLERYTSHIGLVGDFRLSAVVKTTRKWMVNFILFGFILLLTFATEHPPFVS